MAESPVEVLASLPPEQLAAALAAFSDEQLAELTVSWHNFWARPEQLEPDGDWRFWVIVTGRGWGKNRTASEWILDRCAAFAGAETEHLIGLFGRTDREVQRLMIGGVSGLRRCAERRGWRIEGPPAGTYVSIEVLDARGRVTHASEVEIHSGNDPDRCRGRNFNTVAADEVASWRHATDVEGNTTFTNMNLGLRALCPPNVRPRAIITTTPKPTPVVKELLDGRHGPTHVTRGTLLDNRSNLDQSFVSSMLNAYGGTRLERQEVYGEVLTSVEGALWDMDLIHRWRIGTDQLPEISHICIGLDPSGSDRGDECGIVACGKARRADAKGRVHGYVLADASVRNRPAVWGPEVVKLHGQMTHAHPGARVEVIAETNYGGQMVLDTLAVREPGIPVRRVTATKAKRVRAEPVAMLYDQGRWHHVGVFPELEEQQVWWTPLEPTSPDRMDALVWAAIGLLPELISAPASYATGFTELLR